MAEMSPTDLKDAIAKAIADAVGNGMREKYEQHAEAALEVVMPLLRSIASQPASAGVSEWLEAITMPEGYDLEEFLPGIWHYTYHENSDRMASCTSWNHPALAAMSSWKSYVDNHQADARKLPNELASIGRQIATQDNRVTEAPIFIVQEKRESVAHPDYDHTRIAWVNADGGEAGDSERLELDAAFDANGIAPEGWRRLAVAERWEFITACFTEQGCKNYLALNGHNLREPRIYAAGSYRNVEYRQVRSFLLSLASTDTTQGHPE